MVLLRKYKDLKHSVDAADFSYFYMSAFPRFYTERGFKI